MCSIAELITSTRSSISFFSPAPPIIMVSSLLMITYLAEPSTVRSWSSSECPRSSVTKVDPVANAISCIVLRRLSPKPGDFTAATLSPPRSLLMTKVASASLSISSATSSSGFYCCAHASRKGNIYCTEEIFLSTKRIAQLLNSTLLALGSVTK